MKPTWKKNLDNADIVTSHHLDCFCGTRHHAEVGAIPYRLGCVTCGQVHRHGIHPRLKGALLVAFKAIAMIALTVVIRSHLPAGWMELTARILQMLVFFAVFFWLVVKLYRACRRPEVDVKIKQSKESEKTMKEWGFWRK